MTTDKTWLSFSFDLPGILVDDIGLLLQDLGCQGVVTSPWQPASGENGSIQPLPEVQRVTAYFTGAVSAERLRQDLVARLAGLTGRAPDEVAASLEHVPVDEQDWAEGWKQHFSPILVGPVLIRPSWWEDAVPPASIEIVIDPGLAFGTGGHATTRLCLQALVDRCETGVPRSLLDVGTGSGILAIAAARLGIPQVIGCDNDPVACETARDNVTGNGVADAVAITEETLVRIPGRFDVVLANILAETNILLAPDLVAHLAVGGTLVLSGILHEQEASVIEAFARFPLSAPVILRDEEWSALIFRPTF